MNENWEVTKNTFGCIGTFFGSCPWKLGFHLQKHWAEQSREPVGAKREPPVMGMSPVTHPNKGPQCPKTTGTQTFVAGNGKY